MNIKYELTQESYRKLLMKDSDTKENKIKMEIIRVIFFIVINLLPILAFMRVNFSQIIFFVLSCVVYYKFPKIYKFNSEKRVLNRFFYPGLKKNFIEKCSLTVTNKNISYFNNWVYQEFKWEDLKEFREDDEYVYLYFTNNKIIIKRSAFKKEDEIENFLKIIELCMAIIGGEHHGE